MKKHGFTLAEVLVTLGIIGVVAALTAPALIQNSGAAKVGPTLQKAVSTLENANEQLLLSEGVDLLSNIAPDNATYFGLLSNQVKGSSFGAAQAAYYPLFCAPAYALQAEASEEGGGEGGAENGGEGGAGGGVAGTWNPALRDFARGAYANPYTDVFHFPNNVDLAFNPTLQQDVYEERGAFKGSFNKFVIDINGIQTRPNILGVDVFLFTLDKSGSVIADGSTTFAWLTDAANKYDSAGEYACTANGVGTGIGCAGSIFENNLKVIYQ